MRKKKLQGKHAFSFQTSWRDSSGWRMTMKSAVVAYKMQNGPPVGTEGFSSKLQPGFIVPRRWRRETSCRKASDLRNVKVSFVFILKESSRQRPRSAMLWKTPGEVRARTCGTKSPSRSEALRLNFLSVYSTVVPRPTFLLSFVFMLPWKRIIAPFLRRVLSLSAQFPQVDTRSGQINLYLGEITVDETDSWFFHEVYVNLFHKTCQKHFLPEKNAVIVNDQSRSCTV